MSLYRRIPRKHKAVIACANLINVPNGPCHYILVVSITSLAASEQAAAWCGTPKRQDGFKTVERDPPVA
ncbi:MAG: hypothetical protein BroJett006_28390 [Betaproteobacteria bacterium]|nr:MAG: hypothetical protein BroJett006_28390 [Betaproteobacteria bacterium]